MPEYQNQASHRIYSVSELTADIKTLLETRYAFVWVAGEVSNFRIPGSGHFYFTLRDDKAQINSVMFRGQGQKLKFLPEDGLAVTGLGRITVYEPRGVYQIIFEYLEPKGLGALQLAFEQLKQRLSAEGLFDAAHKRPLPFLPRKISVITSPTGAVVHDILKVIARRFPSIAIEIIPVKVQGEGSEGEIIRAIELLNARADADVGILARGGGSLEDLQPFNSEGVARAVFASRVPIVSAVGHEVDYTIADFVADARAPTPSAAAEVVVPVKDELKLRCAELLLSLTARIRAYMQHRTMLLEKTTRGLVHPKHKIEDLRLRIDDFWVRLIKAAAHVLNQGRERLLWRTEKLNANSPLGRIRLLHDKVDNLKYNLLKLQQLYLMNKRAEARELAARLYALSPAAILDRGYSITRTLPDSRVIRNSRGATVGQMVDVMLAKGSIICKIKRIKNNDRTDL